MVNPIKKKGSGLSFMVPPRKDEPAPSPSPAVASEAIAPSSQPERRAMRTGVGLLTQTFTEAQRLQDRIDELTAQNDQLKDERGAVRLDPKQIAPSKWANRHPDTFSGVGFDAFVAEISDAGGNVQPIKVRPVPARSGGERYEVVFGHRRHRACLQLGLPVLAIIEEVDDANLFVQMERENRGRQNLSAWEQGCMYLKAIEDGIFPSQSKLAAAIGRSVGDVGIAIRITKLPPEVVGVFPSPNDIQFRWLTPLERALSERGDKVRAVARKLTAQSPRPDAKAAYNALMAAAEASGAAAPGARDLDLGQKGKGSLRQAPDGSLVVRLPAGAVPPEKWAKLEELLRKL